MKGERSTGKRKNFMGQMNYDEVNLYQSFIKACIHE